METFKKGENTEYMSYAEASELLGVKTGTLYAWVSRRVIPFVRLSPRVVRFHRRTIEKWLTDRAVQPEATEEQGATAR